MAELLYKNYNIVYQIKTLYSEIISNIYNIVYQIKQFITKAFLSVTHGQLNQYIPE